MSAPEIVPADLDGEIVLEHLAPPALERLRLRLSLPNPRYVSLKRFNGGFTGAEPATIESLLEMPDGSAHLPRGCVDMVKEQLGRLGAAARLQRDRRSRGAPIAVWHTDGPELRDYQREGIDRLSAEGQGLVVLPCGCGKSRLGVGAIVRLAVTTLVLVHTVDLADQWIAELGRVGLVAGLLGDGTADDAGNVVVGIIDTVLPRLERDVAWGARFGFVIVDECHRAPSITFQRVLRLLPAYYRLGLTATPERQDGLTKLIEWSFGRVLLERTTREMIASGWLMPAEIVIVSTGFTFEYHGPEKKRLASLEAALASDPRRNALIADRLAADALAGATCLVLVRTREHARELAEMISQRGADARALTGQTNKKKRAAALEDLRAGKLAVLVATSLADEGLDVPRLSVVALASPARARGPTVQRLGRLLRLWKGKKPRLYDFVDDDVDTLASRAVSRRRVYAEAGLLDTSTLFER